MKPNTPASVHPANAVFERALRHFDAEAAAFIIREQVLTRVSSNSMELLTGQFRSARQVFEAHPVAGAYLNELPDDIFTRTSDAYRESFGLYRLEERHTYPAASGSARMGYVACPVVDGVGCLLPFVANSSRTDEILVGGEWRNGWLGLVSAAWAWAPAARCMRYIADDRQSRDETVFATIMKMVRERPGSFIYWGQTQLDPHTDAWRGTISARKSADEDNSRRDRTTAGACKKLKLGIWPYSTCPVGTRRPLVADVRGRLHGDKSGKLEADPAQAEVIERVLNGYARGEQKTAIAVAASRLGARDGDGRLIALRTVHLEDETERRKTIDCLESMLETEKVGAEELDLLREQAELTPWLAPREPAASSAGHFVDRILEGIGHLRTGKLDTLRIAPTPGQMEYQGWWPTYPVDDAAQIPVESASQFVLKAELEPDHPYWSCSEEDLARANRAGFWRFTLEPGTAINLPDSTWEKVERRRIDDRDFHRRIVRSGRSRPMAGLKWTDGPLGHALRIASGGDASTYVIESSDPSTWSPRGPKAWTRLYTLGAADVARALGELLLDLIERVESHQLQAIEPLSEHPAKSPIDDAQERLDSLKAELALLERRLDGYATALVDIAATAAAGTIERALAELRTQTTERARDEAEAQYLDLTATRIPAAEEELATTADAVRSPAETEPPELESVDADFSTIAAVAVALLRCDPYGPAALSNAVSWLLQDGFGFHNLRPGSHPRQVLIDVNVRVVAEDGEVEWIEAGTLDLTDRSLSSARMSELTADAARRLLNDGEPPQQVAGRYHWTEPKLLRRVAEWLSSTVDNHYLRSAAVTAAATSGDLPTGRVLYAVATHDPEGLSQLRVQFGDWIIDQIEAAYLAPGASWAHGTGWVRRPLEMNRLCMLAVAQAGALRRTSLVSIIPGLTSDERLKDDVVPGRTSYWQPPLLMEDGWLSPHVCERAECPGGGAAPITGLLPVPELLVAGAALYCEFCLHPLGHDQPLPEPYTRRWDVGAAVVSLDRADGIARVVESPSVPAVVASPLRSRDVAHQNGVPIELVQKLAVEGVIPSVLSASGKRVFDARQIASPQVQRIFARAGSSSIEGSCDEEDGRLLGSADARKYLGTSMQVVRFLVRKQALANHGTRSVPAYRREDLDGILETIRRASGDQNATLADVSLLSAVAARFDVTICVVRRMISAGIVSAVALGDVQFVIDSSIDGLDRRVREALDPRTRLVAANVAREAGITEATVQHHCSTGDLPSVQLYPRARRFFLREEVDAWLRSRESAC